MMAATTTGLRFRNVFGSTWKKELWVTNVKPAGTAVALLSANSRFCALPWQSGGDGRLCVFPLTHAGKLPDAPSLIVAHKESLVDVSWSPFADVVATVGRDSTAKLWRVPEGGLTAADAKALAPAAVVTNPCRVTCAGFHPHVAGALLTADTRHTVRLWDVAAAAASERAATVPHPDALLSAAFDGDEGALLLTACKDMRIRVFDPRAAPTAVAEERAADSNRGFQARFLEDRGTVLTVGFDRQSYRVIGLRDRRMLAKQLATVRVDTQPYPLSPFYDPAGLLFVGGRGNVTLVFETVSVQPFFVPVGRFVSAANHSGMCMLPKRACDVMHCEVARFLSLTVGNVIEQTSFSVQRKEEMANVFHEDVFPPAFSGLPSASASEWFENPDSTTRPSLASLMPEGARSIFDVPLQQGGKSREQEEHKHAQQDALGASVADAIDEGYLLVGRPDGSTLRRYVTLIHGRCYVFENAEAPTSITFFETSEIGAVLSDASGPPYIFAVVAGGEMFSFEAETEAEKNAWVHSFQSVLASAKKASISISGSSSPAPGSPAPGSSPARLFVRSPAAAAESPVGSPVPSPKPPRSPLPERSEPVMESVLSELIRAADGSCSIQSSKFSVVNHVLYRHLLTADLQTKGFPAEVCHLDRILKASPTSGVFEPSTPGYSFKICTPSLIIHLLASSEELRARWVKCLSRMRREARLSGTFTALRERPASSDGHFSAEEEDPEETALEGHMQLFAEGTWTQVYATAVSDEIFFFASKSAAAPLRRIPLSGVAGIQVVDNAEPRFQLTDLELSLSDGSSLRLRVSDGAERTSWASGLEEKQKKAVDVLAKLGIDEAAFRSDPMMQDPEKATTVKKMSDIVSGAHRILLQIAGKRRLRIWTVEVSWRSLNPNNAFLLDAGETLFLWNGKKASRVTKGKAADLAHRVRMKERSARPTIVVLDQGTPAEEENEAFWAALGGKGTAEEVASQQFPSAAEQDSSETQIAIYRVRPRCTKPKDRRVNLLFETTDRNLPSSSLLHRNNVYIVDIVNEIYVWVGKMSDEEQRDLGVLVARHLMLPESGIRRPSWGKVLRIPQGAEPSFFKELFFDFPGSQPIHTYAPDAPSNIAAAREQKTPEDIALAMQQPLPEEVVPQEGLNAIDDPDVNGTVKMWRVDEGFRMTEVPADLVGQFFSGESYVALYSFHVPSGKPFHVVYLWLGRDCKVKDRGATAMITKEVVATLGEERSIQVRVVQNKEPRHFLAIFHGRFVVHRGRCANQEHDHAALFETRGLPGFSCRTVEASLSAATLNDQHCFVLRKNSGRVFAWHGSRSGENERADSIKVALVLARNNEAAVQNVAEGEEPEEFWEAIGGKHDYTHTGEHVVSPIAHNPRLFVASQTTGAVEVEEVELPTQDDLVDGSSFIVDAFSAVWVWLSAKSSSEEKRIALEVAIAYVSKSTHGHDPSTTPVLAVEAWHEPVPFCAAFQAWSANRHGKPKAEATSEERPAVPAADLLASTFRKTYSLAELKAPRLPEGVDPSRLEEFLAEDDFQAIFKMSPAEFAVLKKWQQDELKRTSGLY